MTNSYRKEYPFAGYAGFGGGAPGLSFKSGATEKTYIDEIFSTYLYKGDGGSQTFTNGLDLSTEGGMVWIKGRSDAYAGVITDTERGTTKQLKTSGNGGELTNSSRLTAFNANGFTTDYEELVGANNSTYASWSFRKAKNFFTMATWTGNSTAGREITHDLGCIPGLILVKRYDGTASWMVYNKELNGGLNPEQYYLKLDTTGAETQDSTVWNNTAPTDTTITLGNHTGVNGTDNYIAYIFGGGKSTAATAHSVEFDGTGDALLVPDDDAWNLGQTFTIEAWIRPDNLDEGYNTIVSQSDGGNNWYMSVLNNGTCQFYNFDGSSSQTDSASGVIPTKRWTHVAIVANSGTSQWYVNGQASGSTVAVNVPGGSNGLKIGRQGTSWPFDGRISNLRIVKGTAVYTSSFTPPTSPLLNITNTQLLCCNSSTVTGSTVTPGTITTEGDTSASTMNPFSDAAGLKFGADADQGVIKCGEYLGNGSSTGPDVFIGWQPEFVMIKQTTSTSPWMMFDSMRGIGTDINDAWLRANVDNAEDTDNDFLDLTPTGFKIKNSSGDINDSWETYVYVAIRSADGYVGKLPSAGTGAFAMDTGAGHSSDTIPVFDSTFPVEAAFYTIPGSSSHRYVTGRMIREREIIMDTAGTLSVYDKADFDWNLGWLKSTSDSTHYSWMWKRGQGFDFVTYTSDGVAGRVIPHSLNQTPEMIWVKVRNDTWPWAVYHKGLNGGTNPEEYYMVLNTDAAEVDSNTVWNDTAPTATHVTFGSDYRVNSSTGKDYIAMLFASANDADGNPISKVGYYTGNGSTQSITTGFQPRFLIIKGATQGGAPYNWFCVDTLRGWPIPSGGDDKILYLNNNSAQAQWNIGAVSSTGFDLPNDGGVNANNEKYIYYAHA